MLCFAPTRVQQQIRNAAAQRWIDKTPRFCNRFADARGTAFGPHLPVIAHYDNVINEGIAFHTWLRDRCSTAPFVLVVPDDLCPLQYFTLQQLTTQTLVMRVCDLQHRANWTKLSALLTQVGPVRQVVNSLKRTILAAIDQPGVTDSMLALVDHAPECERVQEVEQRMLQRSRGSLSRTFKNHGLNTPTVVLHVVRCALIRGLLEQGLDFDRVCGLLGVSVTGMRRKFKRTYGGQIQDLATCDLDTVNSWAAAYFRTDQPVVAKASDAFELLHEPSQTVRRIS